MDVIKVNINEIYSKGNIHKITLIITHVITQTQKRFSELFSYYNY